jgi:TonB family protein
MPMSPFVLLALFGQIVPSPAASLPDCNAPRDSAIAALCSGEELLRQSAAVTPPTLESYALMRRAVVPFRQAANASHDTATKKRALERLEVLFDEQHLHLLGDADSVLRELIAVSPGDVAPMFRLARVQEQQELFDLAESTLLAAHQQKLNEVAPYRELAQFFGRRAAALAGEADHQRRIARGAPEPDQPDADGIYSLGANVQPPERLSSIAVALPAETIAARVSGSVAMEIVVDESGRVVAARVIQSVPLLDETAMAVVRQWRLSPATLDGKFVRVRIPVVVNVRQ